MRVDIGPVRLWVEEHGKGTPLLFLHGFTLDQRMWDVQRSFAEMLELALAHPERVSKLACVCLSGIASVPFIGGEMVRLRGVGHMANMEDPAAFNRAIALLAS